MSMKKFMKLFPVICTENPADWNNNHFRMLVNATMKYFQKPVLQPSEVVLINTGQQHPARLALKAELASIM